MPSQLVCKSPGSSPSKLERGSRRARTLCPTDGTGALVFQKIKSIPGDGDDAAEVADLPILTVGALDEIRQLKHPPLPVRRTLEVVYLVLNSARFRRGIPRDGVKWESVLRTLAADNFTQRMEEFDVNELSRSPALSVGLQSAYFDIASPSVASEYRTRSKSAPTEALSAERVQRASAAAAALFSWASRTVQEAVLANTLNPTIDALPAVLAIDAPVIEGMLQASEVDATGDEDGEPPEVERLSIAVWATCPGGHGLEVGCVHGSSSICAICSSSIVRGEDTASCRTCACLVCVECRRGRWLQVVPVPDDHKGDEDTSVPRAQLQVEVLGFRFLRRDETPPEPLASHADKGAALTAFWRPGGFAGAEAAVAAGVSQFDFCGALPFVCKATRLSKITRAPRAHGGQRNTTKGSAFGLADRCMLGADALVFWKVENCN